MSLMSTGDRLVYMANQIARNFAVAGAERAALATADHIAAFWDPLMKARIFARAATPDNGLGTIAADALALLHAHGAPPSQTAATEFAPKHHSAGSDAG